MPYAPYFLTERHCRRASPRSGSATTRCTAPLPSQPGSAAQLLGNVGAELNAFLSWANEFYVRPGTPQRGSPEPGEHRHAADQLVAATRGGSVMRSPRFARSR
jgi:hypothetical protein